MGSLHADLENFLADPWDCGENCKVCLCRYVFIVLRADDHGEGKLELASASLNFIKLPLRDGFRQRPGLNACRAAKEYNR